MIQIHLAGHIWQTPVPDMVGLPILSQGEFAYFLWGLLCSSLRLVLGSSVALARGSFLGAKI